MALPTLVKTWQFNVNNQVTTQATALITNQTQLLAIKNALIGFATNPWAVRYSCDSTVAGTAGDGVDRWASIANLVWAAAGTAHSWIILRQTGIATNYDLCIALEPTSGGGSTLVIVVSPSAGFTGGTTTARPTATDEIAFAPFAWANSSNSSARWSVMQSTDGQCTRVMTAWSAAPQTFLMFDKPTNTSVGWSNPSVTAVVNNTGMTAYNLVGGVTTNFKMRALSITGTQAYLTAEGVASNTIPTDIVFGNIANEIDGTWAMCPVGIVCTTSGIRGRHGTIQDLWLGSAARSSGDRYPASGTGLFAQFLGVILPWNGGPVSLS